MSDGHAQEAAAPIDAVLADYMRRIDAGEKVDEESLLAANPQFEAELRAFFESAEVIQRMAGPLLGSTVDNVAQQTRHQLNPSGKPEKEAAAKSPTPIAVPSTLGRYRIEKLLGRGGMGAVYLAYDSQLDRRVALKTPSFEASTETETIDRFYVEARAAANLRHAGICPLFDVGEIDGTHYISMAFIDGKPLSDAINSERRLPIRTVVTLVRKMALALDHAHQEGVIHRDLKPSNVMIDKSREPLIMDFGLARRLTEGSSVHVTHKDFLVGTPAYMSPEQVQGEKEVGHAADIYSLGVVFFELLTKDIPFHGNVAAVLGQIVTQDPPSISDYRDDVDGELDRICQKMMAKTPGERFASMKDVADALAAYLRSAQTHATGVNVSVATTSLADVPRPDRDKSTRRTRWFNGRRLALSIVGMVVIALAVVVFKFSNRHGTVVVQLESDVEIATIEVDGDIVRFSPDGRQAVTFDGSPGGHHLKIVSDDGVELTTDLGEKPLKIVLQETVRVRAWLEKPATAEDSDTPSGDPPATDAAETVKIEKEDDVPAEEPPTASRITVADIRHHFSFDGDTRDAMTGVTGTLLGKATVDHRSKSGSGCFKGAHDGFGNIMRVDEIAPSLNESQFSVAMWVRTDNQPRNPIPYLLAASSDERGAFALTRTRPGFFRVYAPANAGALDGEKFHLYRWHHCVVTRDDSELSVYTNGHLRASRTVERWINVQRVEVGGLETRKRDWDGRIDEFTVFNRVLNSEEIATLYESPGHVSSILAEINANIESDAAAGQAERHGLVIPPPPRVAQFTKIPKNAPQAAGLRMVEVPAGTVEVGPDAAVRIDTFFIGAHEVTVGQILTWLQSTEAEFNPAWINLDAQSCPIKLSGDQWQLNRDIHFGESSDKPMIEISWLGALAFCEWCSRQDPNFVFRLPKEVEWEYAARAGSLSPYPWGGSCYGLRANVDGSQPHGTKETGPRRRTTTPVGSFEANAWGVFDTVGNVREWTDEATLRGGSWRDAAAQASVTVRWAKWPRTARYPYAGFRVAADRVTIGSPAVADIGSRLEPLIDSYLIADLRGVAQRKLHHPQPREIVLETDRPWEGNQCWSHAIFRDGDTIKLFYRGLHRGRTPRVACYAESRDGIQWERPRVGRFDYGGNKENNIVWNTASSDLVPFKDGNPACPPESKYRSLVLIEDRLVELRSPDGLAWTPLDSGIPESHFATEAQTVFWDTHAGTYRRYSRGYSWLSDGRRYQDVVTRTSTDLREWTLPKSIHCPGSAREQLYTGGVRPYPRAPHLLIGLPTRRFGGRRGQREPGLMTSRDGRTFDRWKTSLIPTSTDNESDVSLIGGVIPLTEREYSVYGIEERYRNNTAMRIRRYSFRADGLASISANEAGGELITVPLRFRGDSLVINYQTHDSGRIRIELQDKDGRALNDFDLESCEPLSGDAVAKVVSWTQGSTVRSSDEPIRLRVELINADLYSIQFRDGEAQSPHGQSGG